MQVVFALNNSRSVRLWERSLGRERNVALCVASLTEFWWGDDVDARYLPFDLAERWQSRPVIGRATVIAIDDDGAGRGFVVVGPAWLKGTLHSPDEYIVEAVAEALFSAVAWNESGQVQLKKLGFHEDHLPSRTLSTELRAKAVARGMQKARTFGIW